MTPNEVKKYDALDANADMASLHEVKKEGWEAELFSENWHALDEYGKGGCACGPEKGICGVRLKILIRSTLKSDRERLIKEIESIRPTAIENGWNATGVVEHVLGLLK